jgi:hypothetical protein
MWVFSIKNGTLLGVILWGSIVGLLYARPSFEVLASGVEQEVNRGNSQELNRIY